MALPAQLDWVVLRFIPGGRRAHPWEALMGIKENHRE